MTYIIYNTRVYFIIQLEILWGFRTYSNSGSKQPIGVVDRFFFHWSQSGNFLRKAAWGSCASYGCSSHYKPHQKCQCNSDLEEIVQEWFQASGCFPENNQKAMLKTESLKDQRFLGFSSRKLGKWSNLTYTPEKTNMSPKKGPFQ